MPRLALTLHRKPRTRRDRMLMRFRAVRTDAGRTLERLGRDRRRRASMLRAQKLFEHLGHRLHPQREEPEQPAAAAARGWVPRVRARGR